MNKSEKKTGMTRREFMQLVGGVTLLTVGSFPSVVSQGRKQNNSYGTDALSHLLEFMSLFHEPREVREFDSRAVYQDKGKEVGRP